MSDFFDLNKLSWDGQLEFLLNLTFGENPDPIVQRETLHGLLTPEYRGALEGFIVAVIVHEPDNFVNLYHTLMSYKTLLPQDLLDWLQATRFEWEQDHGEMPGYLPPLPIL
jgi:hypothetical protein